MKFEYRIQPLLYKASELEQKLNEAGEDGWEAVAAIECQGKYQVLLKRGLPILGKDYPRDQLQATISTEKSTLSDELNESQRRVAALRTEKKGWTPERRAAQAEAMRQRHAEKRKRG